MIIQLLEVLMSISEMQFLALVIGALTLFGGVLAWATWTESRAKH
jgi:hypothetical protein